MTTACRSMLLVLYTAVCLLHQLPSCHSHGHAHDHGHTHDHVHDHHAHGHDQRPSFKYSREANQPAGGHAHDHGHSHDHDHAHDHDDEHHADSHGEHPSIKYSREANQVNQPAGGHAHDHSHTHDQNHAHNHGHAHDHDHAYDHDHTHSHDHGHVHDRGHTHDHDHAHDHDGDHHTHSDGEHAGFRYSHEASQMDHEDDHGHFDDHGQDDGHTYDDGEDQALDDQQTHKRHSAVAADSGLTLWAISLGSTALISVSPVIVLLLIPLENAREQQPLLKVLLSFASGGLLGDAFLHLIPHAIMSRASSSSSASHHHGHTHSHNSHAHSHDDDHNLTIGLWVLFGIVAFLAVEKFVRYVKGGDSHGHSHVTDASSDKSHSRTDKNRTVKKSSEIVNGDTYLHSSADSKSSHTLFCYLCQTR